MSTVLRQTVVRGTLLSINIVNNDGLVTCNVKKVCANQMIAIYTKLICYEISFHLIISKINHISFTLKKIADVHIAVSLLSSVLFVCMI